MNQKTFEQIIDVWKAWHFPFRMFSQELFSERFNSWLEEVDKHRNIEMSYACLPQNWPEHKSESEPFHNGIMN